ncbi:MAG TPA: DUF4403 family protein [Chitinophagaceae bacterium]|nr:DUF4403 family protein [Chitinophagaceae bacterium]
MLHRLVLLVPLAAFSLISCSKKIVPAKPVLAADYFKTDSLPVSEINIPIQVSLKPLFELAEKKVDSVFTSPNYPQDWVQSSCDTRYKYSFRRGPLQMRAAGNTMTLGFTGYYKIIGSTRVCVSGTAISPWTPPCRCGFDEPERKVNVSFSNAVNFQPDYKVRLTIRRNEPQPLDKCEVCFWGQDITKQVLTGLKAELDLAKSDLEKNYGMVDLKPHFQQVWDQLNQSYNLYNMGWLQINPQRFRINSVYAKNDSLNINLGLAAKPMVSFEKPAEHSSWLPAITEYSNKPGFNIFLDAVLNYDSLSRILNQQIAGKEFDLNKGPVKKKFVIKECELYGVNNEKLIIRVNFSGTDEGTLYLTGKPSYNPESKVLEISAMDFDIRSKDALLKAADWLFNRKIVNEISKYTRYELGTWLETAKISINNQLNREWQRGIRSQGQIQDLSLIHIYPLSGYLVIRSNCTGQLSVKVDSINFSL